MYDSLCCMTLILPNKSFVLLSILIDQYSLMIVLTHQCHPTFPPSRRHQASAGNASTFTPNLRLLAARRCKQISTALHSPWLLPLTDIDMCFLHCWVYQADNFSILSTTMFTSDCLMILPAWYTFDSYQIDCSKLFPYSHIHYTILLEKCTHFTEMYRKFCPKMHPPLWNVEKT